MTDVRLPGQFMSKLPPSLMKDLCEEQEPRQLDMTRNSSLLTNGHLIGQKQNSTIKQFRSYNSWLGRAIELSFNMTIGAGGLSICPSLKVQVVIPNGHPMWRIVTSKSTKLVFGSMNDDNLHEFHNLISEGPLDLSWAVQKFGGAVPLLDVRMPMSLSFLNRSLKGIGIFGCFIRWTFLHRIFPEYSTYRVSFGSE